MICFLEGLLLALVPGPFVGERFGTRLALKDAAQPGNGVLCHGLEQDTLGRSLDDGLGAIHNIELAAQPRRDDDLSFGREPNVVSFGSRRHNQNPYFFIDSVKSFNF